MYTSLPLIAKGEVIYKKVNRVLQEKWKVEYTSGPPFNLS